MRDDPRAYGGEHRGDPDAALVLDETGLVKKGSKSVGVQRQDSGTAGRIGTRRIGVFPGYAGRHGHALIDRALYLPEGRTKDPARRAAAGVPEAVALATEPKLGRAMPARVLDAGVPCAWVVGDSVDGAAPVLRRAIERRGPRARLCPGGDRRPAAGGPRAGRRVGRGPAGRGLAAPERR